MSPPLRSPTAAEPRGRFYVRLEEAFDAVERQGGDPGAYVYALEEALYTQEGGLRALLEHFEEARHAGSLGPVRESSGAAPAAGIRTGTYRVLKRLPRMRRA